MPGGGARNPPPLRLSLINTGATQNVSILGDLWPSAFRQIRQELNPARLMSLVEIFRLKVWIELKLLDPHIFDR